MIGMGQAVGETMIVLIALVTPAYGLQYLRRYANIRRKYCGGAGIGSDSNKYRILFLAALVLFLFTFVINTVAEVVRQRLRRRYGACDDKNQEYRLLSKLVCLWRTDLRWSLQPWASVFRLLSAYSAHRG